MKKTKTLIIVTEVESDKYETLDELAENISSIFFQESDSVNPNGSLGVFTVDTDQAVIEESMHTLVKISRTEGNEK